MTPRITVVGTGYVGLVTGACLAHSGHAVTCVDIDQSKVETLRAGKSPIYEPGMDALLSEGLDSGRLTFTTAEDGWGPLLGDVVFVAVGTPAAPDGTADLSAVHAVVSRIAADADHPLVVVMKSTVPPGTGRMLARTYLADAAHAIGYVSNPEFLREGRAIDDWYATDRIVLGGDEAGSLAAVEAVYADLDAPMVRTDIASAETIKYASNAFLATKISFINEIANVCDAVGADIDSVAEGVGLDGRIGPQFLQAGIGYGGSCFPKDVRALDAISAASGYDFQLLKAVIEVNRRQRLLPVARLTATLGGLASREIAVLGLAFKPNTDDVREAPALDIIAGLVGGGAAVRVYDPLAADIEMPAGARRTADVWSALSGAAAAVLVTDWPEFLEMDWSRAASLMKEPRIVFDGRNALPADALARAGMTYLGVGRDGAHRTPGP